MFLITSSVPFEQFVTSLIRIYIYGRTYRRPQSVGRVGTRARRTGSRDVCCCRRRVYTDGKKTCCDLPASARRRVVSPAFRSGFAIWTFTKAKKKMATNDSSSRSNAVGMAIDHLQNFQAFGRKNFSFQHWKIGNYRLFCPNTIRSPKANSHVLRFSKNRIQS